MREKSATRSHSISGSTWPLPLTPPGRMKQLEGEAEDWEKALLDHVAAELADKIRHEYYIPYIITMRTLSSPSEKLIYLYLTLFQPQTLRTLRRGLGLHENTVLKALRRLKDGGHIERDDEFFWWITEQGQKIGGSRSKPKKTTTLTS